MYRGNNPSALRSQRLLVDALLELMDGNTLADISVSQICDAASVSRQTFYQVFGSKQSMILYLLEHAPAIEKPLEEASSLNAEEIAARTACFVASNFELLRMLVLAGEAAALYEFMYGRISVCEPSLHGRSAQERDYEARYMSAGLTNIIGEYARTHDGPDAGELTRIIFNAIVGPCSNARPTEACSS